MSIEAQIRKHSPFALDIDLKTDCGITVLLGPSGAGKTLTLNCIAGFSKPDEGRILINQQIYFDAAAKVDLAPEQRRCGYLFQDDALFPHMTVRSNLRFAAGCVKGSLNVRKRMNELLERFELQDLADRKPAQLSGGQRQRASLARMLVTEPQVLLLDEPTRGLDFRLRDSFYDILRETQSRLNMPVLLVTHDLTECFALADRVCLIENGSFPYQGEASVVLERPSSVEAARFLGIFALLPAEILALDPGRNTSRLRVLGQELSAPYLPGHLLGDRGSLCIRSSELVLGPPGSGQNELILPPRLVVPSPHGARVVFDSGLSIDVSETEYQALRLLDRFGVQVPRNNINFLSA